MSERPSAAPMSLRFKLPWPPSANHYFVERAVISKKSGKAIVLKHPGTPGLEYRVHVSNQLLAQRIPRRVLSGRLGVRIVAHPPDRRARDLDNLQKALLDALKHADLIRDDSDIDDLHILRGAVTPHGELDVIIDEIPGAATETMPLGLQPPASGPTAAALQIMGAKS